MQGQHSPECIEEVEENEKYNCHQLQMDRVRDAVKLFSFLLFPSLHASSFDAMGSHCLQTSGTVRIREFLFFKPSGVYNFVLETPLGSLLDIPSGGLNMHKLNSLHLFIFGFAFCTDFIKAASGEDNEHKAGGNLVAEFGLKNQKKNFFRANVIHL